MRSRSPVVLDRFHNEAMRPAVHREGDGSSRTAVKSASPVSIPNATCGRRDLQTRPRTRKADAASATIPTPVPSLEPARGQKSNLARRLDIDGPTDRYLCCFARVPRCACLRMRMTLATSRAPSSSRDGSSLADVATCPRSAFVRFKRFATTTVRQHCPANQPSARLETKATCARAAASKCRRGELLSARENARPRHHGASSGLDVPRDDLSDTRPRCLENHQHRGHTGSGARGASCSSRPRVGRSESTIGTLCSSAGMNGLDLACSRGRQ